MTALGAVGTFLAWLSNGHSWSGIDDANIYKVYMRNIGAGHGFVYNMGGEQVDGFTSVIWTLIGSVFCRLGFEPGPPLMCLSWLVLSVTITRFLMVLFEASPMRHGTRRWTVCYMGALALTPGFFDYGVLSQLETGLYTGLLLLGMTGVARHEVDSADKVEQSFCLAVLLLPLCRPEGALWSIAMVLHVAFLQYRRGRQVRHLLGLFGALILTLAALTAWRIANFGHPLPNTYYAKVSEDRLQNVLDGMNYLYRSARTNLTILVGFVMAFLGILPQVRSAMGVPIWFARLLGFAAVVTGLVVIVTGGDHFGYGRFIQPIMPVMIGGLMLGVAAIKPEIRWWHVGAILLVFAAAPRKASVVYTSAGFGSSHIAHEWGLATRGLDLSDKLNQLFAGMSTWPSQGVITAGAQALAYKGVTFDLMGLNNAAMAHAVKAKGSYKNHGSFHLDTMLDLAPDIVWLGGQFVPCGDAIREPWEIEDFQRRVLNNAHEHPDFQRFYQLTRIERAGLPWALVIFAKRDLVKSLEQAGFTVRAVTF